MLKPPWLLIIRGYAATVLRGGAVNTSLYATDALRRSRILRRLQGRCGPSIARPLGAMLLTPGVGPPLRTIPDASWFRRGLSGCPGPAAWPGGAGCRAGGLRSGRR